MKSLEEIKREVGAHQFEEWEEQANRAIVGTPFEYRGADARHTFVYAEIVRQYDLSNTIERIKGGGVHGKDNH